MAERSAIPDTPFTARLRVLWACTDGRESWEDWYARQSIGGTPNGRALAAVLFDRALRYWPDFFSPADGPAVAIWADILESRNPVPDSRRHRARRRRGTRRRHHQPGGLPLHPGRRTNPDRRQPLMAREHARIWLDINADDDFAALSFDAQGFYTRIILTDATLNYCGVADWRPKRLTVRARDLTLPRIMAAAADLEAARYLLFDLDTEEVLARSYIRRDELLRNPKMAATVIKAYASVASPVLRAAIITEVKRIHEEHPDYSSWTHKDTADGLARMLSRPALADGDYTPQFTYADPVAITNGQAVQNSNPDTVPNTYPGPVRNSDPNPGAEHQSKSVPNPSTSTLHPSPAPLEGYVTGERHQSAEPDPNGPRPSDRCDRHRTAASPPPCRACADARHAAEAWDARHREAAEARRRRFIAEIDTCDACDEHGWELDTNGEPVEPAARCPKHDWSQR